MGQSVKATATPKEIADQTEIDEAATVIAAKQGSPPQPFSTGALDPAKNWVVGHSDGTLIAGRKEAYDARDLAHALASKHIAERSELRLVGCHSGADTNSIAAQTAKFLYTEEGVPGVQVKGARGILIKATDGPSGVYGKVQWNNYHKTLTKAYQEFLVDVVKNVKGWFGRLSANDGPEYAIAYLERFAHALNKGVPNAVEAIKFIEAAFYDDNPPMAQSLINPELDKVVSAYKASQTKVMEERFPFVRDAVQGLAKDVRGCPQIQTKLEVGQLWSDHHRRVHDATLAWLKLRSVDPATRQKPGNITWRVPEAATDPEQVLKPGS